MVLVGGEQERKRPLEQLWDQAHPSKVNMSTMGRPNNSETLQNQSRCLGMETPFGGYSLIVPRQVVCDHIASACNVSDPENYVL